MWVTATNESSSRSLCLYKLKCGIVLTLYMLCVRLEAAHLMTWAHVQCIFFCNIKRCCCVISVHLQLLSPKPNKSDINFLSPFSASIHSLPIKRYFNWICSSSSSFLCFYVGHEKSALSRVKKLRQRISASFGRLCEYLLLIVSLC